MPGHKGAENLNGAIGDGADQVKEWISDVSDDANGALDRAQDKLNSLLDDVDGKLDEALASSQKKLKDTLDRYGINIPDEKNYIIRNNSMTWYNNW